MNETKADLNASASQGLRLVLRQLATGMAIVINELGDAALSPSQLAFAKVLSHATRLLEEARLRPFADISRYLNRLKSVEADEGAMTLLREVIVAAITCAEGLRSLLHSAVEDSKTQDCDKAAVLAASQAGIHLAGIELTLAKMKDAPLSRA